MLEQGIQNSSCSHCPLADSVIGDMASPFRTGFCPHPKGLKSQVCTTMVSFTARFVCPYTNNGCAFYIVFTNQQNPLLLVESIKKSKIQGLERWVGS